jgi:quercetin dioxygenase-like cupin family protein
MGAKGVQVLKLEDTPLEAIPGTGGIRRIITKAGTGMDITFSVGSLEPGMGHGWHGHETQDEAIYILAGAGTMSIEGYGDVAYCPGMAIVIPVGTKHQNKNTGTEVVQAVSMFNPALR